MSTAEEWPSLRRNASGELESGDRITVYEYPPPPVVYVPKKLALTALPHYAGNTVTMEKGDTETRFDRVDFPLFGGGLWRYGYVEARR